MVNRAQVFNMRIKQIDILSFHFEKNKISKMFFTLLLLLPRWYISVQSTTFIFFSGQCYQFITFFFVFYSSLPYSCLNFFSCCLEFKTRSHFICTPPQHDSYVCSSQPTNIFSDHLYIYIQMPMNCARGLVGWLYQRQETG